MVDASRRAVVESLEHRLLLSTWPAVRAANHPPAPASHAPLHHPHTRRAHGHGHGNGDDDSGNGNGSGGPSGTSPIAAVSAPTVTTGDSSPEIVRITYSASAAVNANSIGAANITVSGPDGTLNVSAAQASKSSGSTLVATYTVDAPAGGWSSSDNGAYSISLNSNRVFGGAGVAASGAIGSFTVNVPSAVQTSGPNDPTFAGGGTVAAGFVTEDIVSEPNGKLLVVGHQGDVSQGQEQGVIEQLKSNGAPDATFGNKGKLVSASGETYYAAVMPDAKHVIVAGASHGDFVLRRYNLAGTLDKSFGINGTVITDFGTASDVARAIALGPGGTIVAAGDSGGNFAFARYLSNGQLDPNFAQAGRQLFALGNKNDGLGAIVIQSDGRIVAAGSEGAKVVVVRLTSDGEADGTFGNGGMVNVNALTARTDLGEQDHSEGLALASDGGILVANRTAGGHFGLVRLVTTGTVDQAFGVKGLATADFGGDDDADSIVVQSSGPIIVVGTSLKGGTADTALAAFDPGGIPINSFGNNGLLSLPSGIAGSVVAPQTSGAVQTKALHIGDIILRAFGTVTADGRVVIGTTNQAVAATSSSTLRRLIVPGALLTGSGNGTLLGTFGLVNGQIKKLTVTINGTQVTLVLVGGTGTASQEGNQLDLTVDDAGHGVALSVISTGGTTTLGTVNISGTLRAFSARSCDLAGSLHVTGSVGRVLLHDISGNVYSGSSIANASANNVSGTIFAVDAIGRLKLADFTGTISSGSGVIGGMLAASMENATILSGANFGDDGILGGTSPDTFSSGSIGQLRVVGAITSSFIGAGVGPSFGTQSDQPAGTAPSVIRLITAASADSSTRFEATSFTRVRLGSQSVDATSDPRFRILSTV
jgi:uncharacterized delta-60 repeat protein